MASQKRSPEYDLLLCCARTELDGRTADRIHLMARQDVDWPHFLRIATFHGVVPLVYRSLSETCADVLPVPVRRELEDQFLVSSGSNMRLTSRLVAVVAALDADGIPCIPFKGPTFAERIYGSVVLRQFGDIDLLVATEDILPAKACLIRHGYRPEYRLDGSEEQSYLRTYCEYNFASSSHGDCVEIHWGFVPSHFGFEFDYPAIWQRRHTVNLFGAVLGQLAPEDLLLALCVHGTKHHWDRLSFVCDIAELLRRYPTLDWDLVLRRATAARCRRVLSLAVALAADLYGVPESLEEVEWNGTGGGGTRSLVTGVERTLLAAGGRPCGRVRLLSRRLRSMDHVGAGVHHVLHYAIRGARRAHHRARGLVA